MFCFAVVFRKEALPLSIIVALTFKEGKIVHPDLLIDIFPHV
jgi:hypothetical protein